MRDDGACPDRPQDDGDMGKAGVAPLRLAVIEAEGIVEPDHVPGIEPLPLEHLFPKPQDFPFFMEYVFRNMPRVPHDAVPDGIIHLHPGAGGIHHFVVHQADIPAADRFAALKIQHQDIIMPMAEMPGQRRVLPEHPGTDGIAVEQYVGTHIRTGAETHKRRPQDHSRYFYCCQIIQRYAPYHGTRHGACAVDTAPVTAGIHEIYCTREYKKKNISFRHSDLLRVPVFPAAGAGASALAGGPVPP